MTEVALQAGFHSLRRFNAVVVEVYRRSPTQELPGRGASRRYPLSISTWSGTTAPRATRSAR
jgi:hypothetical protein